LLKVALKLCRTFSGIPFGPQSEICTGFHRTVSFALSILNEALRAMMVADNGAVFIASGKSFQVPPGGREIVNSVATTALLPLLMTNVILEVQVELF